MTKSLKDIISQSLINVDENNVSKRDILYLIKETFSLTEAGLVLKQNEFFDDELLNEKIKELKEGKPVEYVLGYAYFCGLKFEVNQNTLIPRGETEDLIYRTKEILKENNIIPSKILDIGSGSGCIGISLNRIYSNSNVESVDISMDALDVAKRNNDLNNTNVKFYLSDCFENVQDADFDLIISNPPYIDRDTYVQESVLKYEPHSALFADNHGLAIYEKIIINSTKYLKKHSLLAFEISPDLKEGLTELTNKYIPNSKYHFEEDINGFIRYLFIIL